MWLARLIDLDLDMAAKVSIRVLLRDNNSDLVAAWKDPQAFGADKYKEFVQVSGHTICQGYCTVHDVEWYVFATD